MTSEQHTESPELKPMVTLTGTARGAIGPPIGLVDIGTNESGYIFRVALPGVMANKSKFLVNSSAYIISSYLNYQFLQMDSSPSIDWTC